MAPQESSLGNYKSSHTHAHTKALLLSPRAGVCFPPQTALLPAAAVQRACSIKDITACIYFAMPLMASTHGAGCFRDVSHMTNAEAVPTCGGLRRHGASHRAPVPPLATAGGSLGLHSCAMGNFHPSAQGTSHKTGLRSPVSSVSRTSPFCHVLQAPVTTRSCFHGQAWCTTPQLSETFSLVLASD